MRRLVRPKCLGDLFGNCVSFPGPSRLLVRLTYLRLPVCLLEPVCAEHDPLLLQFACVLSSQYLRVPSIRLARALLRYGKDGKDGTEAMYVQ